MRKGINPEKEKSDKNIQRFHRVIIPVFIPNTVEDYYVESLQVFESCLNSLSKTINYETTGITVVNNDSLKQVSSKVKKYMEEGLIDKHVEYCENRGKVYAVQSEARASFEPFITVADADVLFFSGWEEAVFEIFKNFPKAGVVSPVPSQNLALYKNSSIFFDNFLSGKIRYEKRVSDEDCDLFLKGMGNEALHWRNNRTHSWRQKQYFMETEVPAILGANHFVATYRKEVLRHHNEFPFLKFKKGYEEKYLDEPADRFGWYRLSTASSFAYHVGNKMDSVVEEVVFDFNRKLDSQLFSRIKFPGKSNIPYRIRSSFFRLLRKIHKL